MAITNKASFAVPPESPNYTREGRGDLQSPHTGGGAGDGGERAVERTLAVNLDLRGNEELLKRLKDLSWQAARYRNLHSRAKWADAAGFCRDPQKAVPNDVSKYYRATEKMDLSGAAYSAAEREVQGSWTRSAKRILAGAPLPEWSPNAAISVRGHKNKAESGVRLTEPEPDRFVAHLQIQNEKSEGGCWLEVPLNVGTAKDWQADLIRQMVSWEIPIKRATVEIKPFRHKVILRLSYAKLIVLPRFGNRCATLGPIRQGARLTLRTETETRDYTGRLRSLLDRKDQWDAIRRRAACQFGKTRGSARAKRKKFSQWDWKDWLDTHLHQWSREIIDWLDSQGVSKLSVVGLGAEDWPIYRFTQLLIYKGEEKGIQVSGEADLAEPGTERAVKRDLDHQRRKTTKRAAAIRTLINEEKREA